MKNKLFYLLIIIITGSSLWMITSERFNDKSNGKSIDNKQIPTLSIGDKTIFIEIVKTEEQRVKGLSDRKSLPKDSGMLFIFDKPDFYNFWMKDMNFPIDIVWMDKNYKIVNVTKNLKPETYPNTVTSQTQAQYILELNTDSIEQLKLKIGDILTYKP